MENPIIVIVASSDEEEKGNGMRELERKIISDLSGFPNFRAMVEAEAFMMRKKKKKKRRRRSEVEEEAGVGNGTPTTTMRSKVDEYREISDLIGFNNLRAMTEAEALLRSRNNKRIENKPDVDFCFQETDVIKEKEKENPIVLIISSEEEGNGREGKRINSNRRTRPKLDEYEKIADLSGFPNLKVMIEAEASMRRNNKRKASQLHNELKMDPQVILTTNNEEEEEGSRTKAKKRKRSRRTTSKLDEYEKISNLSGSPNLKAMIEAEAFLRIKNKRNIEASQLCNEIMMDPPAVLTTRSEEKEEGNESKEKGRECEGTKRSKLDEFREISDSISFDNLKDMTEAEVFMWRKMRSSKKKRSKKKRNVVFCAQEEVTEQAEEEKGQLGKDEAVEAVEIVGVPNAESVQISEIDVPQNLVIDAAKEKEDADTVKAVETTVVIGAGEVVNCIEVIMQFSHKYDENVRECEGTKRSKLDEFREISDSISFDNLKDMTEAEVFMWRKMRSSKKKRSKKKRNVVFCAQEEVTEQAAEEKGQLGKDEAVEAVEIVEVSNAESVQISEIDVPQNLEIDAAKEKEDADTVKAVETTMVVGAGDVVNCIEVIMQFSHKYDENVRECEGTKRSKLDEFREISDSISFDNLKDMTEAEVFMWRKMRSSKKKRSKKKRNVVFCAQEEVSEQAAEEKGQLGKDEAVEAVEIVEVSNVESVQISEIDVPQNLEIDAAKEKEDADTVKAVETTMVVGAGDVVNCLEVINRCLSSPEDDATIYDVRLQKGVEDTLPAETVVKGKKKKRRRKKVKISEKDMVDVDAKEENNIKDNVVPRMLHRKPRYFDPPNCDGGSCSNCGKENHTAANCKIQRQDKPCFICGSFDHIWKYCRQGKDCFVHQGRNHLGNNLSSNICLRCGDPGHDMFSCRADYPADDLKAIQCYVCKNFGHLCCVYFPNTGQKQVSCYNCGESGHMGSECIKSRRVPWDTESSIVCYKCGKEGHYARRCSTCLVWQRADYILSTAERSHNETRKLVRV